MSIRRDLIAVACLLSGGAAIVSGPARVRACDASSWITDWSPLLRCLELTTLQEEGRLDVHNTCAEEVEITPVECDDCPKVLHVAPDATSTLPWPTDPKDGERRVFDYRAAEQSGTIVFTYNLNSCPSEEGCSAAASDGQSAVPRSEALFAFLLLLVQRFRHGSKNRMHNGR